MSNQKPMYLFDIEGNGLGLLVTQVWCVVIKDRKTKEVWRYRPHEIDKAIAKLQEAELIVAHNGVMYDVPTLERMYKVTLPYCLDTMLCSRLLYPDIFNHPIKGNELADWGTYVGREKIKYMGGWGAFSEEMLEYCVGDVEILDLILDHIEPKIKAISFAVKLEHQVAHDIAIQIRNGISFDLEGCEKFQQTLWTDMAAINDELQVSFPPITHIRVSEKTGKRLKDKVEVFNPGSVKQIASRFINKYQWKFTKWTEPTERFRNGQIQIDDVVLATIPHPEARLLERWSLLKKRLEHVEAWLENYHLHKDGRVHGDVNPLGCVSSRMAHKNPNLAQVTKVKISKATKKPISGEEGGYGWESRSLFRASNGMVLIGADLSGLELRCLANRMWQWDNGAYAKVLLEGDVHSVNMEAAELSSRDTAKTFIYAFLYGAGDAKIGRIVGGDAARGKELKAKFLAGLPALGHLLDYVRFRTRKYGTLIGIDGRLIPVRAEHMALNTQLQSDGAIIAKVAFVLACRALRDKPVRFLLNIHDEFQTECPPEIAHETGKTMVSCMQQAGRILKCKIEITGEYKIGNTWAETH